MRRWIALSLVVLCSGGVAACGGSDDPAPAAVPRLLTLKDLEKYPSGSPEAALMRHFFFIQWGSARNLVASLDPAMTNAVGIAQIIDAYGFLRPALATSKLRIVGKLGTNQGTLLLFEVAPVTGPVQTDSILLGKEDGAYVIRYDTQLDRGIPGAINASTAGEPATKQGTVRLNRRVAAALDRYHNATGAPGLESALRRAERSGSATAANEADAAG